MHPTFGTGPATRWFRTSRRRCGGRPVRPFEGGLKPRNSQQPRNQTVRVGIKDQEEHSPTRSLIRLVKKPTSHPQHKINMFNLQIRVPMTFYGFLLDSCRWSCSARLLVGSSQTAGGFVSCHEPLAMERPNRLRSRDLERRPEVLRVSHQDKTKQLWH